MMQAMQFGRWCWPRAQALLLCKGLCCWQISHLMTTSSSPPAHVMGGLS